MGEAIYEGFYTRDFTVTAGVTFNEFMTPLFGYSFYIVLLLVSEKMSVHIFYENYSIKFQKY